MAELIQLEIPEAVTTPPEGYVQLFYTEEDGYIVKKIKLSDGSVLTVAEE